MPTSGSKMRKGYAYRTTHKPRSPSTSDDEAFCDKDVPKFRGAISKYPEYRKRMILYFIKCEIEGGKKLEACPTNLISGLSGSAWDETEGMDMTGLKGAAGFAKIQKLLDEAFKYKARTEMHHLWDDYIYGFRRSRKMTLQEYIGQCRHYPRRILAMKTKDGVEKEVSGMVASVVKIERRPDQTQKFQLALGGVIVLGRELHPLGAGVDV